MEDPDRRKPFRLPILIANGFSPFPIPLHIVRGHFHAHGCETHVVPFRVADMRDVEVYARHIAQTARDLARKERVRRINLLGYSMGGVASLYAMKRLGLSAEIATFVGLGSPFHGTRASWFAVPTGIFSLTGLQLVPDSAFLKKLHADPLPAGPRYVTVAGRNDIICPPRTASLDGDCVQVMLPINHAEFMIDPLVADLVVPFLC